MTKANVWRRPINNQARPCLAYTGAIRRDNIGWRWSIMCHEECITSGHASTKNKAVIAVREAKERMKK